MVSVAGFEPATSRFQGEVSAQTDLHGGIILAESDRFELSSSVSKTDILVLWTNSLYIVHYTKENNFVKRKNVQGVV